MHALHCILSTWKMSLSVEHQIKNSPIIMFLVDSPNIKLANKINLPVIRYSNILVQNFLQGKLYSEFGMKPRCHQEYVAAVTENTELKRMEQQEGDGQGINELKAKVRALEEELRVFQEKHDQRIADKNQHLQKQQDILDAKFNKIACLEEQVRAMQTLIDTLNKENSQLKKQRILEMHEENTKLSRPIPAPKPTAAAPPTQHYHPGARHPQHYGPQSKSSDANPRVCPVCGVRFPRTADQTDIERHVNGHFDH